MQLHHKPLAIEIIDNKCVVSGKQAPVISLFAAASVGAFADILAGS